MVVYNTFPSLDRYDSIPMFDRLVWAASLAKHRYFGYSTKIYCKPEEVGFLKENALLGFYDSVDVEEFAKREATSAVDMRRFWSTRKTWAIAHEVLDLGRADSVYCDTDIIMRMPFFLNKDALFWSPENACDATKALYPDWDSLSKPEGFDDADFLRKCDGAYNMGVFWVKDQEEVREWLRIYESFAAGNPCLVDGREPETNSVFPCNAEQRTLRAILERDGKDVRCVMDRRNRGLSPQGTHFYWYRMAWKVQKRNLTPDAFQLLNETAEECLKALEPYPDVYAHYAQQPWLEKFAQRGEPLAEYV